MLKEIMLGDIVEDTYTGFIGIATTSMTFINDCVQFEVVPKVDKDNKPQEGVFIDVQSLKLVKKGKKHLDYEKEQRVIEKEKDELYDGDYEGLPGGPNHKPLNLSGHYNRRKI